MRPPKSEALRLEDRGAILSLMGIAVLLVLALRLGTPEAKASVEERNPLPPIELRQNPAVPLQGWDSHLFTLDVKEWDKKVYMFCATLIDPKHAPSIDCVQLEPQGEQP